MKFTSLIGVAGLGLAILMSSTVMISAASSALDVTGLQLYSLRDQFAKDVPGTLEKVKDFGLKYVELAGNYNQTPEEFKTQLDAHRLKALSAHIDFNRFRTNAEDVAREAKIFGLEYVGCAWIPHGGAFDEKTCTNAIAVFNHAGEVLAKQGIKFFYHTHGYEFEPHGEVTLFDRLVAETNPGFVGFEMDVFWIVHAGQDPVKLLEKYPNRWLLLHLKGMRDTTPVGFLTGHTDLTNDVAVGTGKIDYVPVLRAAKKAGTKWCFIEDESAVSEQQIPQSVKYLESVTY